jgi:putative transposase
MARITPAAELPTVWTVPDDLWHGFIVPILRNHDPEPRTGRPRIDQRRAWDGIIFILRSGCRWNRLPREFGNDSSVHRTYQRRVRRGLFRRLWSALVADARRLRLVKFAWQSVDRAMGKARFEGRRPARTPRIGPSRARTAAC